MIIYGSNVLTAAVAGTHHGTGPRHTGQVCFRSDCTQVLHSSAWPSGWEAHSWLCDSVQELSREKKGLTQRHESLARTSRDAERKARDKLNELQEVQVRGHGDVLVEGARRRDAGRSAGLCVCVRVSVCVFPRDLV